MEIYDIIASYYNSKRGWFGRKISNTAIPVILKDANIENSVIRFNALHYWKKQGIDTAEVIAIAKAICRGAETVCPFVDKL